MSSTLRPQIPLCQSDMSNRRILATQQPEVFQTKQTSRTSSDPNKRRNTTQSVVLETHKKPVGAEEVVVKMELMGLKQEEDFDYRSRGLSTSSSSTSSSSYGGRRGRRKSFGGPPQQAELDRLADVFASNGVKVVSVDMPPLMQIHVAECARKTLDSLEKFTSKTLALALKKEFDGAYGPAWHCIVGESFGSFVTHSVNGFMYFSMDQKLYILLFKPQ